MTVASTCFRRLSTYWLAGIRSIRIPQCSGLLTALPLRSISHYNKRNREGKRGRRSQCRGASDSEPNTRCTISLQAATETLSPLQLEQQGLSAVSALALQGSTWCTSHKLCGSVWSSASCSHWNQMQTSHHIHEATGFSPVASADIQRFLD